MDSILEFYRLQEVDGLIMYWLKEILVAALIFAGFWLLAKVVRYLLITWGPRFTSFTKSDLDDRILQRITPPIGLLVVFAGLYLAVKSLPLPDKAQLVAAGTVFLVNIVILTNIAYRALDELMEWFGNYLVQKHGAGVDRQIVPVLEKLITIFLVCTALIITLKHFNYDILSLVTALGIGSLAIGMAAKETLANIISGFTLMIDRPFRIGDRIQLKDGNWGDVTDIGLRTTKIKTADNTVLIIPNADLCNTTIINQAFPDQRIRLRNNVGVGYGSDVEKVRLVLTEIALGHSDVLHDPAPQVFLSSFGDSALNFTLFYWVNDYTKSLSVSDRINTRIIERFRVEDIEIPYPTRALICEKDRQCPIESK